MDNVYIYYHLTGYKCFQYYYNHIAQKHLRANFPKIVNYEGFIALMTRVMSLLLAYLNYYRQGEQTGIYYADSKKLPVCDNRRINQHEVFKLHANRGNTNYIYKIYQSFPLLRRGSKGEIKKKRLFYKYNWYKSSTGWFYGFKVFIIVNQFE